MLKRQAVPTYLYFSFCAQSSISFFHSLVMSLSSFRLSADYCRFHSGMYQCREIEFSIFLQHATIYIMLQYQMQLVWMDLIVSANLLLLRFSSSQYHAVIHQYIQFLLPQTLVPFFFLFLSFSTATSVTRLGYFWTILVTDCWTKIAQKFTNFWALMKNVTFKEKNCFSHLSAGFG